VTHAARQPDPEILDMYPFGHHRLIPSVRLRWAKPKSTFQNTLGVVAYSNAAISLAYGPS
jgi:hypothetical protein